MFPSPSPTLDRRLHHKMVLGIALSTLLHLCALLLANIPSLPTPHPTPLSVEIVPPEHLVPQPKKKEPITPPPSKRQLVTPSTSNEAIPQQDTTLLSDRNATVTRQQLKRGDDPLAGQAPGAQSNGAAAVVPPPTTATQASPPKQESASPPKEPALKQLTLNRNQLAAAYAAAPKDRPSTVSETNGVRSLEGLSAFSRPSGSGARFFGRRGATDYLPDLPDGDITLLNTKASRFAVFVRRVATSVFRKVRSSGWERLSARDILALEEFVEIHARLNLAGDLVEAWVQTPSGSRKFDLTVLGAVQEGAEDGNPPPEAALPDGTIHFLFKAKCWTRPAVSAHSGAPSEQRWLLLGTGLL